MDAGGVAGLTVLGLSGLALVQPVAAAQALGLTVDELQTQLWAGEALADLATAAGVDLQVVQDAVTAANVAATRTAIAQAVTEGTLP